MKKRLQYALTMAWQYRKILGEYRRNSVLQSPLITLLNPAVLKATGIQVMILDFDGVLAAFGETRLPVNTVAWLQQALQTFGAGNIFILTNKPTPEREHYLAEYFPGINFFWASKKKPYPDGILQIITLKKVQPEAVLMVDDRLLTGILGAIIAKVRGCYITEPLISFNKRPVQELFFMLLRSVERWLI
jgi:predicted HAD superfamily phosphohydrolase YqeG